MMRLRALTFSRTSAPAPHGRPAGRRFECLGGRSCPRRRVRSPARSCRSCVRRAWLPTARRTRDGHTEESRGPSRCQPSPVHGDTHPRKVVDFLEQRLRIDHDPFPMMQVTPGCRIPTESGVERTSGLPHRPCGRRCGRLDTARPPKSAASACRRSCLCLRRPTGRRAPRCSTTSVLS